MLSKQEKKDSSSCGPSYEDQSLFFRFTPWRFIVEKHWQILQVTGPRTAGEITVTEAEHKG